MSIVVSVVYTVKSFGIVSVVGTASIVCGAESV